NSLLTPASSVAPNSIHEEDVAMNDAVSYTNTSPNKRRRTSVDSPSQTMPPNLRSSSEAHGEAPSLPNVEELLANPDVSPYYLVCEKPYTKSYPELSEDLISLYGLKPIADKVARFNPAGAKNKLRKSYKGFINNVAGKNDVVARATSDLNMMEDFDKERYHITYITKWPEEDWKAQNVYGKEVGKPFDMSKLRKGLAGMTKGDVPGFDASILGLDDEPPRKAPLATSPPAASVNSPRINVSGSTPGNLSTGSAGVHGDDLRPQRKKRRRYNEG
ncbi:Rox3 mediator complex subunit-domain-containing protein, partial [Geopyxis carbonaria]